MSFLFNTIFYQPLLNLLVWIYEFTIHDFGVAIILLTVIIRMILFPFYQKSMRHQTILQRIQPKIKKIQEQHKNDREKQAQALMALYQEHNVNPFFSFFFLLLQIPIMFALYRIILNLAHGNITGLYAFTTPPGELNTIFLNLINLSKSNIIIVILAAGAQYFQAKLALRPKTSDAKDASPAESMARSMAVVAPLMTLFIFYSLPSAITLYWFVVSLISVVQQIIINKELGHGEVGTILEKNP